MLLGIPYEFRPCFACLESLTATLQDQSINNLNVIHVAGTKGKGSTCAFARSFLLARRSRTGSPRKVGLYTSPALKHLRERIQINERPIRKEEFTSYFFEVWDTLFPAESAAGLPKSDRGPKYLQLLATIAFHTFIKENVDVAIFETHHGGEFDATNVVQSPAAVGITSLGLDHVAQLGPTIEDIAWHKAGIFKHGTPAFSVPQKNSCARVLEQRATEKQVQLKFVPAEVTVGNFNARVLGVSVQKMNCSLALALVDAYLQRTGSKQLLNSSDIDKGIEAFHWPGRFEILRTGSMLWYLDGAHNELSVREAAEWYRKTSHHPSEEL